jgi:tetratricopeptide (TPR) repeat protein
MIMLRIATIFLCAGLMTARAGDDSSQTNIGLDPSLSAGAFALRSGRFAQGVALTLAGIKSVRTSRDRASAFNNLCAGYLGTREYSKALDACDKALDSNHQNWRIYNNRALALFNTGRIDAARDDLKKGLAINPDSPLLARVAEVIDAQVHGRIVAKE